MKRILSPVLLRQCLVLFAVLCCSGISFGDDSTPEAALSDQAAAAFASGHYQHALSLYRQIDKSAPSVGTTYNLAVCYYKLKDWRRAKSLFAKLHQQNPSSELVRLNLALTEAKLGNLTAAQNHLYVLASASESDAIAMLAYRNYLQIEAQIKGQVFPAEIAADGWLLNAGLGYGSNDNIVTLTDDTASQASDTFTEANFSVARYSSPDFDHNWAFDVGVYRSQFDQASDYDVDVASLGLLKHLSPVKRQRLQLGLRVDQSAIGGEAYLLSSSVELLNEHRFNKASRLKYGVRYSHAAERNREYQAYAGNTVRLDLKLLKHVAGHRWELGYRYESEDKNDAQGEPMLLATTTFTSYSAVRHSIIAQWSYHRGDWRFATKGRYRDSRYRDAHIFGDGSTELRDDTRTVVEINIARRVSENFSLELSWESLKNSSSIKDYDYSQNIVLFGVVWQN
ncbi:MAG: tetratricopeptide repeat protein [Zhongshania sp.]|uniref:tetratricopeptide repeat protein n=1 Tax=Zhongshania sp. TaxID=1971902 RepID=UPI002604C8FE|nr:tetratricopeptide repeat protein [Zhongshania sp.]MDF1692684.1 tetratricopeptide repeat protein [Zhongshania sp.]